MVDDSILHSENVAVCIRLYKRIGLFMLLSKNKSLMHFTVILWIALIVIYSVLGLSYKILYDDDIKQDRICPLIEGYINYSLAVIKLITIYLKSSQIINIFDITRFDFLKSCKLKKDNTVKLKYQSNSVYYIYIIVAGTLISAWVLCPLIYNTVFLQKDLINISRVNVIHFYYPISEYNYDTFFYFFYINEALFAVWLTWIHIVFDVLFSTLCVVISTQYETIFSVLTTFGVNGNQTKFRLYIDESIEMLEDLKMINLDFQNLHEHTRQLCSIFHVIALLQVITCSCSFITCSYVISLQLLTRSLNYTDLIKFIAGFIFNSLQFYMYSYSLDLLNEKRDGVNFGFYSCNWTAMDIRFKKILISTMKMNNANQIKIKATPMKIVDLMLFLKVLQASYSVVSFMLKRSKQ